MDKQELGNWIGNIVSGMVDNPDKISIVITNDDKGVLYTLRVGEGEAGRVIGKEGDAIKALRTILRHVAGANDIRAYLKLDAPPGRNFEAAIGEKKEVAVGAFDNFDEFKV